VRGSNGHEVRATEHAVEPHERRDHAGCSCPSPSTRTETRRR
jgi:hypothetical protein